MPLLMLEAYTRVFVDRDRLDQTSLFYQQLLGGSETQRFEYPEKALKLAVVKSTQLAVLIVSGSADARSSFEATRLTIAVKSLDETVALLLDLGATQLEPIQKTPKGRKTRFCHVDGLIVEYVENHSAIGTN